MKFLVPMSTGTRTVLIFTLIIEVENELDIRFLAKKRKKKNRILDPL